MQNQQSQKKYDSLYRNYLGEFFTSEATLVKKGEYFLDENEYEHIVEDLVLESVKSKMKSKAGAYYTIQ
jgi:hypothetical protein